MARVGALDLGSNSLKLTVADISASGEISVIAERASITRVGQGLDQTKRLADDAIARTIAGLRELVDFARVNGAERLACVATAGLRGAENAGVFLERAARECGLEVRVIDGLEEADLAFQASAKSYGPGPIIVVDVGGRSTEIVTGRGGGGEAVAVEQRISLEVGSVRLTERFLPHDPPESAELASMHAHLARELEAAPAGAEGAPLVGVSGTVLSLMGVQLGLDDMGEAVRLGEGQPLRYDSVLETYADLRRKTAVERLRGTVIPPGRADVIVAGAWIVAAVMKRYGKATMIASNRGVRYGLLHRLAAVEA